MGTDDSPDDHEQESAVLTRRQVIYCGKCGMPPEYCEYGPDFETHCDPWLRKYHPELAKELAEKRGGNAARNSATSSKEVKEQEEVVKPELPWTLQERLTAFYEKYVPEKIETIPSLLEKYAGKEEKLFQALTKKYGPEPKDPYYSDSEDEDEEEDSEDEAAAAVGGADDTTTKKGKRRGASAKKGEGGVPIRVVVSKVAQKKKRSLTIISGMETIPNLKLKDASKAFSKRFAGSSSVKENPQGNKEIIIQGDHMYDVAEMIVDKFDVPESAVFLDLDGDVVPLR